MSNKNKGDALEPEKALAAYYDSFDWNDICEKALTHISMGGTLPEFCRLMSTDYNTVSQYLRRYFKDDYKLAKDNRNEYLKERVIEELMALATFTIGEAYDADGNPLPLDQLPDNIKKAIQSISKGKEGTTVRFADKLKAIEMVGKKLGIFNQKIEHTGGLTLESLVSESFKKDGDT